MIASSSSSSSSSSSVLRRVQSMTHSVAGLCQAAPFSDLARAFWNVRLFVRRFRRCASRRDLSSSSSPSSPPPLSSFLFFSLCCPRLPPSFSTVVFVAEIWRRNRVPLPWVSIDPVDRSFHSDVEPLSPVAFSGISARWFEKV